MLVFLKPFENNIIVLFFAAFFILSIWEYIAGYILSPDRTQIQEDRLEDFTEFLCHEGRLAHIDIVVNALDTTKCDDERCNLFVYAIEKAHPNPWASFCYGETIGTSQELTRFFYIETEK